MINWNARSYTKEEFIIAWNEGTHIAEVARLLDLSIFGSTYRTLKNTANELDLSEKKDMRGWNNGKTFDNRPKRPLIEFLQPDSKVGSSYLKKRLLSESVFKDECSMPECRISTWHGEKITLQLDHIDGDNTNNCLANLRLLCPNCHSLTDTFCRGKSKKKSNDSNAKRSNSYAKTKKYKKQTSGRPPNECIDCGIPVWGERCKKHAGIINSPTKIDWPEKEELLKMLEESNY